MARYRASLDTERQREELFTYLSDFSPTQEWDPGVVSAERVNGSPVQEGAEFRLLAEFLGRRTPITYRIIEFDPPHALTFFGENERVTSCDRITFEALAHGTRITYDAALELKRVLKVADPLLGLALGRVGDRALSGLRRKLASSA